MQGELFEWVIVSSGQEFYLTEKQHEIYIQSAQQKTRVVQFDGFTINPAYVKYTYKRKATGLKKLYPCDRCRSVGKLSGKVIDGVIQTYNCPKCKGSGVDFENREKTVLPANFEA